MISIIVALLFQLPAGAGNLPARLKAVSSFNPPPNAIAGTCVLADASVDLKGNVGGVTILEGTNPFSDSATLAIKQWKFNPASHNGQPVMSRVGILSVFRPAAFGNQGVGGPSLGYKQPAIRQKAHPPVPLAITDPGYPQRSIGMGVVIIELTIDKNGIPSNIRTIQDVPSLTDAARGAIQSWRFMPAMESGQAVDGTLIVAISFLRPVL